MIDNIEDKELIANICKDYRLNYSEIAEKLGVTRQAISIIAKGSRPISNKMLNSIRNHFPIYFTNKPIGDNFKDVYSIRYCDDVFLPEQNNLNSESTKDIILDRILFEDIRQVDISSCVIVRLSDDSLSPLFNKGDRFIIDTSKTSFMEGRVFAFLINNRCYLRRIQIFPDKVKCISIRSNEDTFEVRCAENIKILGAIVSNIRF